MCSWKNISPSETESPNTTASGTEARNAASSTLFDSVSPTLLFPSASPYFFCLSSNPHRFPLIPQDLTTHSSSSHTSKASRYVESRYSSLPCPLLLKLIILHCLRIYDLRTYNSVNLKFVKQPFRTLILAKYYMMTKLLTHPKNPVCERGTTPRDFGETRTRSNGRLQYNNPMTGIWGKLSPTH